MPEFENDSDRLEQFFRKATNKPDLAFSEDDWSKLEARLDAADASRALKAEAPNKSIITTSAVGVFLLLLFGIWWGNETGQSTATKESSYVSSPITAQSQAETLQRSNELPDRRSSGNQHDASVAEGRTSSKAKDVTSLPGSPRQQTASSSGDETFANPDAQLLAKDRNADIENNSLTVSIENGEKEPVSILQPAVQRSAQVERSTLVSLTEGKVRNELVVSQSDITERNKQRARIELPGAEEADQTGGQTMVEEEHASEREHVARPRLSLLLLFAPDFSGTALGQYSPPGKAFGGMIHYHLRNRWSISAGVVKNYKQYTGAGEDYTPPTGYWKYYTNGVIPETIDGSCSVLEFPIMVQYTLRDRAKNRWIVGAGASSYLMQTESYRYTFAQPNPGAKEGWDSRGSSRFMFNMLNLTIGYEHQIIPGLMIGLEPYVKLPLEEIGWSNLKLYSSGASVTLRYTLIPRKQMISVTSRSRGPD